MSYLCEKMILTPSKIIYKDDFFSFKIRPLESEDAPILHSAVNQTLSYLLPFMDWAHEELSEESQAERIEISCQRFASKVEYDFAVFDDESEFLVSASFHPSKTRNKNAVEIGYWTHAKHRNKGLATVVTKILTVVAFEFLKCDRVEIGCNKDNTSSKRVIEKCKFVFEGEVRNYFSKATTKMLKNKYSSQRNYLSYALTTTDLDGLTWYSEIKERTIIIA